MLLTIPKFYFLLLIYFLFGCLLLRSQPSENALGMASVEAKEGAIHPIWIQNKAQDTVLFIYLNPFSDLIRVTIIPGQVIELETEHPIWITNPDYQHGTNYLLRPLDSLEVDISPNGGLVFTPLNGGIERTNELAVFYRINNSIGQSYTEIILSHPFKGNPQAHFSKIDSLFKERHKKELKELEHYLLRNSVSEAFKACAHNVLKQEYNSKRLTYLWTNRSLTPAALSTKVYFDSLYSQFSNIDENICSPYLYKNVAYSYFLRSVQYKLKQLPFTGSQYNRPNSDSLYKYAKQEIKLQDKLDTYLFLIVKEELSLYPQSRQKCINQFFLDCTNESYKDYIKQLIRTSKLVDVGNKTDVLIGSMGHSTSYQSLIDSLKGNVIYIDVWASWCVPCRKEMAAEKELMERFKGSPVKFILLSQDANINAWKEASDREGITKHAYNFLMPNFENTIFRKKFNISSIPRYILIDKKGAVVSANAPRPSDTEISTVLTKLSQQ